MYAITLDLNLAKIKSLYPEDAWHIICDNIAEDLKGLGFEKPEGVVYFAPKEAMPTDCIVALQKLAWTYPWLKNCIYSSALFSFSPMGSLRPALG